MLHLTLELMGEWSVLVEEITAKTNHSDACTHQTPLHFWQKFFDSKHLITVHIIFNLPLLLGGKPSVNAKFKKMKK
jgi:hypothetical protein